MVEPLPRFDEVLIGIVDGIHDAVCTDLEKDVGEAWVRKLPLVVM